MKHYEGLHGLIIVKGLSKATVLLENGRQQKLWLNKKLKSIVGGLIEETTDNIVCDIDLHNKTTIPYFCQYEESYFQCLQRLAHRYNEWFYFNEFRLFFGKPTTKEEVVEVKYDPYLSKIELKTQTYNPNLTTYSYDSLKDKEYTETTKIEDTGLNELGRVALNDSKSLHKKTKTL